MPSAVTTIGLLAAGVLIPGAFVWWCVSLARRAAPWQAYVAYFFLFGTVGGWALAFGLSPSGLAAVSLIFLAIIAPVGCLAASLLLFTWPEHDDVDLVAAVLGLTYAIGVAGLFAVGHKRPNQAMQLTAVSPAFTFRDYSTPPLQAMRSPYRCS